MATAIGLFGGVVAIPAPVAAQAYSGQERPGSAELRNAVRRLAANPKDLDALIDAGTASLQLGDVAGAVDFFTRAEAIAPNNGDVKVGLGTAMLRQENPVEALRLFDEAERLGMPARSFALDRGLAYDLVGDFANAERQYQIAALAGPSDEITLRRGISLGVQGREQESTQVMMPLLERNDPGAWRAQAFIYAANGHMADADGVAKSFLGDQKARAMQPYFQRMPMLTPAQKMAAIHFGHFPTQNIGVDSPQIAALSHAPSADRLTPQGQPFGPSAPPVAAAAAKPPKFLDFNGRPQKDVRYTPPSRLPTPVAVAGGSPPPVQAKSVEAPPVTTPAASVASVPAPTTQVASIPSEPVTTVSRTPATVAGPAFESVPIRPSTEPTLAQSNPDKTAIPSNLPSGYQPSVSSPSAALESPTLPPAGYSKTAGTYVDSQGVTRRIGEDGTTPAIATTQAPPKTEPAATVASVSQTPVTPTPEVLLPPVSAPPATVPNTDAAPSPRRPDLAAVVGTVAVPEEEKASTVVPVTPDVIAGTPVPTPTTAPATTPRVVTPKAVAKPTTPKAEAAKPAAKPEEKPAAKHPKRNWVQIATGSDVSALRYDFRTASRKNPDLFKGLSAWTSPWGKTRRMVVGPFETLAEAKAWEKKWLAAGGQGFAWQSEDGTVVEPLPAR